MCDTGTVLRISGGICWVLLGSEVIECSARGNVKKREGGVFVGDHVRISQEHGRGVLEEVLPRTVGLARPTVANVDQVIVVTAASEPEPNLGLLDRILVLVEHSGLRAVLCITKIDLDHDRSYAKLCDIYSAAGYRVIPTSARTGAGVEEISRTLAGRISVFAGPSGAGKSALLNAVQPGLNLSEGEVSAKIGRGRHTTREVRLLTLDGGGLVADSPGFSSLDIEFMSLRELAFHFPEMREHMCKCRFSGCVHDAEPDCAVKEAVEFGVISESRYSHYLSFLAELREAQKRQYK